MKTREQILDQIEFYHHMIKLYKSHITDAYDLNDYKRAEHYEELIRKKMKQINTLKWVLDDDPYTSTTEG